MVCDNREEGFQVSGWDTSTLLIHKDVVKIPLIVSAQGLTNVKRVVGPGMLF
jgi:hypothetical protein